MCVTFFFITKKKNGLPLPFLEKGKAENISERGNIKGTERGSRGIT